MADENQLKISFTADTEQLVAATRSAQTAIGSFSDNVRAQSSAVNAAATQALSPFTKFAPNVSAFNSASSALVEVEQAAISASHGTAGFYREIVVLGHEIISGRFSRIPGSMMVLAERSGQLATIFEGVAAAATPMNLAIAATVVTLGAVAVGAERAAENLAAIRVSMASVGNEYLFDPNQVQAMEDSLTSLAGVGAKDATAMLRELGSSADLTESELKELSASFPDLIAKFGSTEAAGKAMREAIDDPAAALRRLHDELARNNPQLLDAAESYLQMGDKADAARAVIDYLTESSKGLHDKGLTPLTRAWEDLKTNIGDYAAKAFPVVGTMVEIGSAAKAAASGVMTLATAMGYVRSGSVGLRQAISAAEVQRSGQTYNMDQSAAYIERQKELNQAIADGDDLIRKLNDEKLDKLDDEVKRLQTDLKAAQAQGDTADVAKFQQGIANLQAQIADETTKKQKQEQEQQVRDWESSLTEELQKQGLFGDQAKAFELKFWQDKQQIATQGTAAYDEITKKIYDLQSQTYEKDLEAFKENERKKQEEAKKAQEQNIQDVLKHFDELAALYKGDYQSYIQIEQQKLTYIKAIYGQESSQAEQQSAKIDSIEQKQIAQSRQNWNTLFGGIKSSFNSAIDGMISGTESFGQATRSVFIGIGEAVIKVLENIAEQQLITWVTGRTAADVQAEGDIAASAAQAGAAAYASTAAIPIIGPELAPAAGAAAYQGAIAYAALASFDVGSWSVPKDMVANIHQGEMILPKPFADSLRENGGFKGGGGQTVINISAVDANSVYDLIAGQPDAIAAGLASAARNGNRNLRAMMR